MDTKPPGPVHCKVTPGVRELPSRVTELILQFRVPPVADTFGTLASGTTEAVAVAVQPFGEVTVRVYTPMFDTVGFGPVYGLPLGPTQVKTTPGVLEEPLIVVLLDEQVIIPPVAAASGAAKSPATMAVAVVVHWLVAVTVNT